MKKENTRSGRMMFRTMMAFAFAGAAMLAVPTMAHAWGRGGKRMHRKGKGKGMGMGKIMRGDLKRMQKVLQLKPWQVNKIKQLRKANQGKFVQVKLQMARIHAKMRVEWLANKPNAWKLKKLHQQKLKLKTKMANRRFNVRLRIAQILTPTQRLKLKRRGHRGRRWSRRGKGGKSRHGRFGRRGRRGRI